MSYLRRAFAVGFPERCLFELPEPLTACLRKVGWHFFDLCSGIPVPYGSVFAVIFPERGRLKRVADLETSGVTPSGRSPYF